MNKLSLLLLTSFAVLSACTTQTPAGVDAEPHTLGSDDAKVTIQEFSDVQCPACGAISPQVEQFVRNNPELVRLEYFHFPLSYHEHAFMGAEAAECAGEQGKFFEYLGTLFQNQNSLSEDFMKNTADSLNLDRTKFDACMDNHTYKAKIQAHMEEGTSRGLPGTPSLYINGELVRWTDPETFKGYLESL